MKKPIKIVIIGGGFGGIYTYLGLHNRFHGSGGIQVTLISETDYFLFVVLAHEVATGTLLPSGIVQPIRTLPHCCLDRFIEGRATEIDADKKILSVKRSQSSLYSPKELSLHIDISYDYLIAALGSRTNFFDTPGASERASIA